MFRRVRVQLTVICALCTGAVLVAMAAAGLRFSLLQLERQAGASFDSAVKTVVYHLQSQPVIDQGWLTRTEADNNLWIRVESEGAGMQYTRQNPVRETLTAAALEQAREVHGFEPAPAYTGSLEASTLQFPMRAQGRDCFACVAAVPRSDGWLQVVVVRDRSADQTAMGWLTGGFALCVVAGVALLVAFAWVYSGRATRPAEESHRRQAAFVSAASHELRAPLSVIRMSAGTMRTSPGHAHALAEKIEKESGRMAALIDDLLFLARTDEDRAAMRMAAVPPRVLLLATAERFEPLAGQRGVRLETRLPAQPSAEVFCDRQLIEQVLAILTDNGLRFAPPGGTVLLSARWHRSHLLLAVDDSGPGVPEPDREQVFQRFYQADAARSDREHYGLGLSIAAEITALHRGRIWVEDSELGGARFVVRLRRGGVDSPDNE